MRELSFNRVFTLLPDAPALEFTAVDAEAFISFPVVASPEST